MFVQLFAHVKNSYREFGAPFLLPGFAIGLIYPFGNLEGKNFVMSVVQDHLAFNSIALLCGMSWFFFCFIIVVRGSLPLKSSRLIDFFAVKPSRISLDFASVSSCMILGIAIASMIWRDYSSALGLGFVAFQILILQGLLGLVPMFATEREASNPLFRLYCGVVCIGSVLWFYFVFFVFMEPVA